MIIKALFTIELKFVRKVSLPTLLYNKIKRHRLIMKSMRDFVGQEKLSKIAHTSAEPLHTYYIDI